MLHTVGPRMLGADGAEIEESPIAIVQGDSRL
jgi:hypothetical protein